MVGATHLIQQNQMFGFAMVTSVYMIQRTLIELSCGHLLGKQIPDVSLPMPASRKKLRLFAKHATMVELLKITDLGMLTITLMGIGKCIRDLIERPA